MDIRIEYSKLPIDKLASLSELDEKIKKTITNLCSEDRGRSLQVEYGTALTRDLTAEAFRLTHNASFELGKSYVIADAVSTILKTYFSDNPFPEAILLVNLTFSKKEVKKTDTNAVGKGEATTFIPVDPKYSFDRIVLPQRVYDDLINAVKIIEYRDLIYNQWGYGDIEPYARCIINMYGPAGTGKTMCAHAIAHKIGKKLLALNYSEIESKYLGEAAKNLAAAFNTAKETDSVLFFDEADSFLGKRVQNVTQSSDQALNSLRSQMLILLEKFDGIIVFATNLVSNFDEAFMSRIQKHIKFELPNAHQISEIVKKQIPVRLPLTNAFSVEEFYEIGESGMGLSGREIKNAIFEMYLQHAGKSQSIAFSPKDFVDALTSKIESNKKIEEEKNKIIKERIIRKIAEKKQEQAITTETTD